MARRVDVDITFRDIVDHLQGAFMAALEGRYGRWTAAIDVNYLKVEDRSIPLPAPAPPGASADYTAKQTMIEFQARYQFLHRAPVAIDVLAGGRVWILDNSATISETGQPTTSLALDERWTDPFLGARASIDLSPRVMLQLHGDVGGFDAGSKFTWQALGTLRYRISSRWAAQLGYRDVDIDFRDDGKGFFYDVGYRGPVVSATYRF
jgi:hypothetical protein